MNMNIRSHRSPLAVHTTIVLALSLVLGSSTAFAGRPPSGGGGGGSAPKPPTPTNFRVTAKTAYTITVAWDPAT